MAADPRAGVARLPAAPGVYRFRDAHGRVPYVGRAVDLRRRERAPGPQVAAAPAHWRAFAHRNAELAAALSVARPAASPRAGRRSTPRRTG